MSERPGEKIPIARPLLDQEEHKAVLEVLKSGWLVQGPKVARFEELFRAFVGARHAIATSSCTSALHLALLATGIGPGDEVIVPSFTFVATANAVEYTGARPLFVDIDASTFTLDPAEVRELLNRRKAEGRPLPKAVMPVSLFGLCADMEAINDIARDFGLIVIEDAACALGATRRGRHAGTEALAGCFSFHPRKAVTTGEGGMIVTDDDRLAESVRQLRDHGASKTDLERHIEKGGSLLPEFNVLGFNYRMTDLQGAIGTAQMAKAAVIISERQSAAARYRELLGSVPHIRKPVSPEGFVHAFQSYVCLYGGNDSEDGKTFDLASIKKWNVERNFLMAYLEKKGVSVRQGTHAVHTLGYYREKYNVDDRDYPRSYLADRLSITLPLYAGITYAEQARVADTIQEALGAMKLDLRRPRAQKRKGQ